MNKKTTSIICVVLVILALICFGFILINSMKKEPVDVKKIEVEEQQEVETTERNERGQNVNLNSRIGYQLKELIQYTPVYSSSIINSIDLSGLRGDTKLLVALDKMNQFTKYQDFMQYSDTYSSTYILESNMNNVVSETFEDASITKKEIDDVLYYDEATNAYIILPHGFANGSLDYVVEVPYKIVEYSDRIEMLVYRVYAKKTAEMNETESKIKYEYFANSLRETALYEDENSTSIEADEVEYLKEKIDEEKIDFEKLSKILYTFSKEGGAYKIRNIESIK